MIILVCGVYTVTSRSTETTNVQLFFFEWIVRNDLAKAAEIRKLLS